jgi:protein arginine N-methyltransferase 1
MYWIHQYGELILDKGRMDAFVGALRAVVRTDSVVIDMGTGAGTFALLACQFGARKVYAIEPSDIIQLGQRAAVANGWADRIEFIQGMSTSTVLPEKAHILIADLHGVFPVQQESLYSIIDARKRLLVEGATLIPGREIVWAGLLHAPEAYAVLVKPWETNGNGINQQASREIAVNNLARPRFRRENLVSEPRCCATLDYRTLSATNINARVEWTLDRSVTVHGIAVWFDCETAEGFSFTNIPGSRTPNVYGDAFFPWLRPVELAPGDRVAVDIRADPVRGEYQWCWNSEVTAGPDATKRLASFRQSTFQGTVISPRHLHRRAQSFVPSLSEEGLIDRSIFQ